mgnify:CR=1 FL=1
MRWTDKPQAEVEQWLNFAWWFKQYLWDAVLTLFNGCWLKLSLYLFLVWSTTHACCNSCVQHKFQWSLALCRCPEYPGRGGGGGKQSAVVP